jgi:aminopeptidase
MKAVINQSKSVNEISPLSQELIHLAAQHLNDILTVAIQHSSLHSAVIISDAESPLAVTLTQAYRQCLPTATFIDFYSTSQEEVLASFKTLVPSDLVILIQSTSFRLDAFRLRIELFQKSLKVIEHPHLARMTGSEAKYYIEALAYDPMYFRTVGHALKNKIDRAAKAVIDSGGEYLVYESRFEPAKLNIGDYTNMKNIGGQFPIGEVFTEAENLESVNGRVRIFVFGDTSFSVNKPDKPITLVIQKGRVVDAIDSTSEFDLVLANIRADEGEVWVRELGFGLNRAFSEDKTVSDIGTYERMCGIHLSLGAKHTIYKKPNFKPSNTWHHVDVFVKTHCVYLDDDMVYEKGAWR